MQELLLHLNSIHPLTNELQEHLIKILSPKKLSKKDYLLKAGHVCQSICFIQKGLLKCFYHKDQHEVCSWFMKEGDVIVSVESFFNQSPSYESIQAIEDTEVYCISHQQLEFIYKKFPEFNFVARVLLQKYYTLSEQRLFSLRMQKSQERYDYLLEHHPELVLRVPAKYLGSYLGITEWHFSHIRGKK
jgi:CRP-like cAMP-binding protein